MTTGFDQRPKESDLPLLNAGGMITCKYTCGLCGITKQDVGVPARFGEEVTVWLRVMMTPALVRDHQKRSPDCHPTEFDSVWIPIPDGTKKIGGPVVQ